MEDLTEQEMETISEEREPTPIKSRKQYEFTKKRYNVEIEIFNQPNHQVGKFCTLKEVADAINELNMYKFNVSKHMVT